jgi:hypothetical protein
MSSNKQRRETQRLRRERKAEKAAAPERERRLDDLASGRVIRVRPRLLVSRSVMLLDVPEFYRDLSFVCRDCGKAEVWTAKQQQWWYEVAGGEIETKAIRCRRCRQRERERRAKVRAAHEEGLRRKRARRGTEKGAP